MLRYFRTADAALYESIRLQLDAAWGHPNAETKTETCIDPAAVAPRDSHGRILLAVRPEFCEFAAVAAMLPSLLAGGVVEEIDASEYQPVVDTPEPTAPASSPTLSPTAAPSGGGTLAPGVAPSLGGAIRR